MKFNSLVIIEVYGIPVSLKVIKEINFIENLVLLKQVMIGDGIITLFIQGKLGAINNMINKLMNNLNIGTELKGTLVIPLPHSDLISKLIMDRK